MITRIAACIPSFQEEEGGPELVGGSSNVAENTHLLCGAKGHVVWLCAGAALSALSKLGRRRRC